MRKSRVLVVDDNRSNRVICKEIFEHLGCAVDVVESGEAALALVAANAYDLVCLDRFMPGMSGDEVAARLPGDVIVVAWSTDPSDLPTRYDGVLCKPITIPAAAGVLATAIATREASPRLAPRSSSIRRIQRHGTRRG